MMLIQIMTPPVSKLLHNMSYRNHSLCVQIMAFLVLSCVSAAFAVVLVGVASYCVGGARRGTSLHMFDYAKTDMVCTHTHSTYGLHEPYVQLLIPGVW